MALRVLMLQRQLADAEARLAALQETRDGFAVREAELETAIAEAEPNNAEQRGAVEEAVTAFENEQSENRAAIEAAETEIRGIREQIEAAETAAAEARSRAAAHTAENTNTNTEAAPEAAERSRIMPYNTRALNMLGATHAERAALVGRQEVQDFLANVRSLARPGAQQRAVTGADLLIPDVLLDILRENIERYSRLLGRVRLRSVVGTARQNIVGAIPEAVWTEAREALNALEIVFTQIEVDANKVGGYVAIPNCDLFDGDDQGLTAIILDYLGQAIGLSLDKAICYGDGDHKPVGFVTRLACSSQPAWWGSRQGDFTDLHTSNVLTLNINSATGASFWQPFIAALGVIKGYYSQSGELTWIMNHKTHVDLMSRAVAFDVAGAYVAGMNDVMPIIGGRIVEEDRFMADGDVIGGYLDCQLMVEREGTFLGRSEHALFIEDQTVFKGTSRWDGNCLYGEAFVAVNYKNSSPATTKTFATDYAGGSLGTLIVTSAAGSAVGTTHVTVAGATDSATLKYALGPVDVAYGDKISGSAWSAYTDASTNITAATGSVLTVVELDAAGRAVKSGFCIVTAKAS